MTNNIKAIEVQAQMFDDLYFSAVSPEEMNELHDKKGARGLCVPFVRADGVQIFIIYVRRDLDVEDFCGVFCHELYHYCIDKITYNWHCPQLSPFISEMLSDVACWGCKNFGSINCWRHPKNRLHAYIRTPIFESLDDEALLELGDSFNQALKECPSEQSMMNTETRSTFMKLGDD